MVNRIPRHEHIQMFYENKNKKFTTVKKLYLKQAISLRKIAKVWTKQTLNILFVVIYFFISLSWST